MLPDRQNRVRVRASFDGEVEVKVREGDRVEVGTTLVVVEGDVQIETLSARRPGRVVAVEVKTGQDVRAEDVLVILQEDAATPH